jgi:medium-chain acyl-[acyl-carrier-protein] hydrolase
MMTQALDAWVTCPRPEPRARVRLFCLPYAGGGASIFRHWPNDLAPAVEVCPVQLPGRENRFQEPRYTSLTALVGVLAEVMEPYMDKPFAFFGHSMGALICFELCRTLRARSGPLPAHLFISARPAPQLPRSGPLTHNLPDAEFKQHLSALNGTSQEVFAHAELMQILLPLLRADFALVEGYRYGVEGPLPCPISAFGGLQDESVEQRALAAWSEQAIGAFRLRMFAGDHFFLQSRRSALLQALSLDLTPSKQR